MDAERLEEAWKYAGRFLWRFGGLESVINEIFGELFNLNSTAAGLLFAPLLDQRKKLKLIEAGLKEQGTDQSDLFKRVHKLHDIRNVIAHASFDPVQDGISFDYVGHSGDTRLPNSTAPKDMKKWQLKDFQGWGIITYSEFDAYDAEVRTLTDSLLEICSSIAPITDFSANLASAIEEAISSSDNVVRFPKRSTNGEKTPPER
jgi:hypothetical protein